MRHPIEIWHEAVRRGNVEALDTLLAADVVFHSPVVHTPQRGQAITRLYLAAAFSVLNNASFRYVREIVGEQDAMLEFTTEVDGVHINGVDIIHWNAESKLDDFKVMVRPLKAINHLHARMREMLERLGAPGKPA